MGWSRFKHWLLEGLEPDQRLFGIAYLLLLPLFWAPLFATHLLPGLDLPFHLSMTDMLNKSGTPGSPYGPYYVGSPEMAPYAAHYVALHLLSYAMSLVAAHKTVVMLYVAALPAAAASLLAACGRSRLPALLAFPLAYNLTLHYGFITFALSLPVVLWLLAQVTKVLLAPELSVRRWASAASVGVLAFLCHLQNFAYGVCAALAFIAFSGVRWRRRLEALSALVPALAALAMWQVRARFTGDPLQQKKTLAYAWDAVKTARLLDMRWGRTSLVDDLTTRLEHLPSHVLRGFTDLVDVTASKAMLLVIAAYFLLGIVGMANDAGPKPRMRIAGWVAFFGAFLAYLVLPHHLPVLELMTFSPRFAVLAVLMTLLIVPGSLKTFSGWARLSIAVPAVVFCAMYGQQLTRHYRMYGEEIADFEAAIAAVPPGGKLLGLVFDRQSRVMRIESALVGLPNFYPAMRPSPGSMVPLAYCGMRHMPCRRKEPLAPFPDPGQWDPHRLRAEEAIFFFDYFIARWPPRTLFGALADRVEALTTVGSWTSYRRKPGAKPPPKPAPPPPKPIGPPPPKLFGPPPPPVVAAKAPPKAPSVIAAKPAPRAKKK